MLLNDILGAKLEMTANAIICTSCHGSLKNYCRFLMSCLDVEEKLKEYHKIERPSKSHTELYNSGITMLKEEVLNYYDTCGEADETKDETNLLYTEQDGMEKTKSEWLVAIEGSKLKLEDGIKMDGSQILEHQGSQSAVATAVIARAAIYDSKINEYQSKIDGNIKDGILHHSNSLEVTTHRCDVCGYQTNQKRHLMLHTLTHENASKEFYKCNTCEYRSSRKYHLQQHILKHKDASEITMHKCNLCSYQSKYKHSLQRHILVHKDTSEVTTYKCNMCVYQTMHKHSLQRHTLVHKDTSEVTAYKCNTCVYQTKNKQTLKQHMLTHKNASEVIMYKCDICDHQTKRKEHLERHMLAHKDSSEVTMYKCGICNHQTKYKSSLYKHMIVHRDTSKMKYGCSVCEYQTKDKQSVKRHMLSHKNVSEISA